MNGLNDPGEIARTGRMGTWQFSKTELADGGNVSVSRFIPAHDLVMGIDLSDGGSMVRLLMLFTGTTILSDATTGGHLVTPVQGCAFRNLGASASFRFEKWIEVRALSVSFAPEFLARHLGEEMPWFFQNHLTGEADAPCVLPFPVSQEMRMAMEHNISPGLTGGLRRRQLEAAAMMLIMAVVRATKDIQAQPQRLLTARERRAAHEVYERLVASLRDPPSLVELSRAVSLPDKRLNMVFREIFGGTVFDVLRNLRLEQARNLLECSDMSIKEVAWHVGYAHVSNFTSAFTGFFGVPPASYLKAR